MRVRIEVAVEIRTAKMGITAHRHRPMETLRSAKKKTEFWPSAATEPTRRVAMRATVAVTRNVGRAQRIAPAVRRRHAGGPGLVTVDAVTAPAGPDRLTAAGPDHVTGKRSPAGGRKSVGVKTSAVAEIARNASGNVRKNVNESGSASVTKSGGDSARTSAGDVTGRSEIGVTARKRRRWPVSCVSARQRSVRASAAPRLRRARSAASSARNPPALRQRRRSDAPANRPRRRGRNQRKASAATSPAKMTQPPAAAKR